jgi:hypothetical protein
MMLVMLHGGAHFADVILVLHRVLGHAQLTLLVAGVKRCARHVLT